MRQTSEQACPAAAALKVFGDAWTLFIVDALSQGEQRFSGLERSVNGICPVTLTNRLKKLEQLGCVRRKEGALDRLSVTYSLTPKGMGMLPIIKKMRAYAEKYLSA